MGYTATENDSGYRTYTAETPSQFDAAEPILVENGTAEFSVIALATPANAFGVFQQKLQPGPGDNAQVSVRLLNSGGTVRIKSSAAFTNGDDVHAVAGGTVEPTGAAKVGTYQGPDASSGAYIEVLLD